MNYLDIFGRKVQKFAEPAGTLDYTQYLPQGWASADWSLESTPKGDPKPGLPEGPEDDSPSEFGPMGSVFDFSTEGVADARQQQRDALFSNDQSAYLSTLSSKQKAAATGGIDLTLGGRTSKKFDWQNSKVPWEMIGDVASAGLDAVDQATMGDKNFNAESQALDAAADGAAKMASKFGPWGLLAAGIIKTVNFGSKALGGSVEGYDVGDLGSGYASNLGHMEQQSGRLKDRLSGKTARDLKRRNEQAQLALKAKDVVDDVKFEQEARMNSVNNVIERNQIALSGGINTGLLAAKRGGKLERLNKFVTKAQYGAKLKKVEVSEEPSLLPEGELHKNKHDDFDLPVTKKGIPVITVENGAEVSTIIDLQENKDDIQQHAEIERSEVIFSKELTDYIEDARKKWHDGDDSVLLEVGKRVTKELLQNTQDNTGLIRQLKENE